MNNKSRRQFLKTSAIGMAGGLIATGNVHGIMANIKNSRLPREVWIGTVSQERLEINSKEEMIKTVLGYLENMRVYQPDIICLPETFTYVDSMAGKISYGDSAEAAPFPSLTSFMQYAKENHCYLICPIIIKENGMAYNAAVVIDRNGEILGNYKKSHPTVGEMGQGIFPGPLDPPVFDLDFGRIGIQICFDIQWRDGWESLAEKDPDIIFWPSAFSGRTLIQTKAWECTAFTVSSTIKGPSRICDISGDVIARTEYWNRNWICAPVNLEKVLIHTWPHVKHFSKIKEKYGRKIKLTTYDEEEWTVVESLSSDIKVKDVLNEFDILTFDKQLAEAEKVQNKKRP
jgi:predicted amidohydrolase